MKKLRFDSPGFEEELRALYERPSFPPEVGKQAAAIIDEEVKRIFDEASLQCEEILRAHADVLVALAEYLLINETIDGDDFRYFCDHKCMPPTPEKAEAAKADSAEPAKDAPAEPEEPKEE